MRINCDWDKKGLISGVAKVNAKVFYITLRNFDFEDFDNFSRALTREARKAEYKEPFDGVQDIGFIYAKDILVLVNILSRNLRLWIANKLLDMGAVPTKFQIQTGKNQVLDVVINNPTTLPQAMLTNLTASLPEVRWAMERTSWTGSGTILKPGTGAQATRGKIPFIAARRRRQQNDQGNLNDIQNFINNFNPDIPEDWTDQDVDQALGDLLAQFEADLQGPPPQQPSTSNQETRTTSTPASPPQIGTASSSGETSRSQQERSDGSQQPTENQEEGYTIISSSGPRTTTAQGLLRASRRPLAWTKIRFQSFLPLSSLFDSFGAFSFTSLGKGASGQTEGYIIHA